MKKAERIEVRVFPDPILKTVAKPYAAITESDCKLAYDMLETMYYEDGVGLAAPQIGVSKRLIVCAPQQKNGKEYIFFNPKMTNLSGQELGPEGCLSLPGISGEVLRSTHLEFTALDVDGKELQMEIDGFFARIIQHEIDHLDGILYVDRVNFSKRKILMEAYHNPRVL